MPFSTAPLSSRPRTLARLLAGLLGSALAGCALAGGLVGCDDDGGSDGGVGDAGPGVEPSALFGACQQDSQCPGEGAICRTAAEGFPGGYCTVPCMDRTPCDDGFVYNHCLRRGDVEQSYCELRCLNGIDCGRDGWTCLNQFEDDSGACIPVCGSDEQCGDGAQCNPFTGECTTEPVPDIGAVTGETCANDDACRSGACITEVDDAGQPSGWVGGYCISNCILPPGYNTNSFFEGDALPSGSCPGDTVCLPRTFRAASRGDLGACYDQCTGDGDCRQGYTCLQEFRVGMGSASYSNGVCVPGNCMEDGCPTGYGCVVLNEGTMDARAVCAPQ